MNFFRKFLSDKYYILTDQALVSVMNFGAIFFLSGLLSENIFSQFVLVFVYITLAYTILSATFSAPILVFATKRWSQTKFNYLFSNVLLLLIFGFVLSVIEFFFMNKQIPNSSFGLFFFVIIGMSLMDLLKRFIFSTKFASLLYAPLSSILANIFFFSGIFLYQNQLTVDLILLIYGLTYLLANILLGVSFVVSKSSAREFDFSLVKKTSYNQEIFQTHFRYSKWILLGSVSFWVYTQGIYIYANALGSSDFVIAKTRSIQNLFGIFTILMVAMENYLTPVLSQKALVEEDSAVIVSYTKNMLVEKDSVVSYTKNIYVRFFKKTLLLYLLVIPVMYLVYVLYYQDNYGSGLTYIIIMWLTQLIAISTKPLAIALKVKEVTYPLFLSHLYAALLMIILGYLAITIIGDHGLILAMLGAYIIANATNYVYYKKVFYHTKT